MSTFGLRHVQIGTVYLKHFLTDYIPCFKDWKTEMTWVIKFTDKNM